MLGGTTDSVGERLGRDGGHGLHDGGHGDGGGHNGGEEAEAACHSLPVQVTRSVQIGKIVGNGLWVFTFGQKQQGGWGWLQRQKLIQFCFRAASSLQLI